MPITSFTIDSTEVRPVIASFDVRETVGGVSTLSCDIVSAASSPVQRFDVFSEVVVVEDGTTIFSGTITQTRERGVGGPVLKGGVPQIVTTITAEDHNRIAERISITESLAADTTTLKAFLTTLVTNYLDDLGVTLHASQADGPTLPEMSFETVRANEVLQALSDATGYLWRIDYDKQLRMWLPGDLVAPFNIDQSDSPPRWGGDVEVETMLGDSYANRVIVICAPVEEEAHVEQFTGDGTTSVWDLEWTLLSHRGYVTDDLAADPDVNRTLTTTPYQGTASWTYHPATNTLERDIGPLPNGQIAAITFRGTFQATATAEDAADIAANGLYEHIERRDDITTQAAAQELADQILAERLNSGEQIVSYETRYTAPTLRAGQRQTITAPARDVSGDFIIRDIQIQAEVSPMEVGSWLTRRVTAKAHEVMVGKWQHTYRDWLRFGSAGTASVGEGGVATSGPAPPDQSIQFNRSGGFGGNAALLFHEDADSVTLGDSHDVQAEFVSDCGDTFADPTDEWDVVAANIFVAAGGGVDGTNGLGSSIAPYNDPWLVKAITPTPTNRVTFKWSQWIPTGSLPFTGFANYVVAGVYYANGGAFAFANRQVSMNTEDDGRFYFLRDSYNGTTIAGPTTDPVWVENEWNEIEIELVVHDSAGSIVLRRNGVEMLSATGLDTQALADAAIDGVEIVPQSIAGEDAVIDNVEINVSQRNLLTGRSHIVVGDDNLLTGVSGTVVGDRNVLHALCDSSPAPSITGSGTFKVCADVIELEAPSISINGGSFEAASTRAIGITIDGAGSAITTGVKGFVVVPFAGTITKATLLSTDASATAGSVVIDVWKDSYANYPPTDADSITAAAPPTLSAANKSEDSTLTGWTTAISAGDVLGFNVDSATTVTRVTLALEVTT